MNPVRSVTFLANLAYIFHKIIDGALLHSTDHYLGSPLSFQGREPGEKIGDVFRLSRSPESVLKSCSFPDGHGLKLVNESLQEQVVQLVKGSESSSKMLKGSD